MNFVTTVMASVDTVHAVELPMPAWVYGVIVLVLAATLGVVVFSYRDVANRHHAKAEKFAAAHGEHGKPGH